MYLSDQQVRSIYEKADGECTYCGKKLAFRNYGVEGAWGAWHADHSRSRANGGSDHLNNLVAACVDCNYDKGSRNGNTYKRYRERNGLRVPEKSFWEMLFGK